MAGLMKVVPLSISQSFKFVNMKCYVSSLANKTMHACLDPWKKIEKENVNVNQASLVLVLIGHN